MQCAFVAPIHDASVHVMFWFFMELQQFYIYGLETAGLIKCINITGVSCFFIIYWEMELTFPSSSENVFGNMKTPWWKWRRQTAEVDDCWLIKKKEKKHINQVRRWIHYWQSLQSRAVSQRYIKTHITSPPKEKIRKHLREKRQLSSGTTFWRLNQNDFEVRAEVTRSQCYSTATVSIDNTLSLGFREISEADGATVCSTSAQYWDTDGDGNFVFQLDKQPELVLKCLSQWAALHITMMFSRAVKYCKGLCTLSVLWLVESGKWKKENKYNCCKFCLNLIILIILWHVSI